MKRSLLILSCGIITSLILFACGDSEAQKEREIFEVREVGVLSTTEYTLSKIVKWNDEGEWYKWGDRRILFSVRARVKAGVDLSKIGKGDIKEEGNKITINVPKAQVISFDMDPDDIKTEKEDISGLRAGFSQKDKNAVLKKGEESIRKDLELLNILKDAQRNAEVFLVDFYKNQGFEEVVIQTKEDKK
ncbi:MAG: DUF4230 domain-containing protein [Fluviicola sp.]|jgi:hypothetical protein